MKTAISIPDPIFAKAEQVARELGLTRSALYTRAIEELVARHDPKASSLDPVTARINELVAEHGPDSTKLDPDLRGAHARFAKRNPWK